MSFGLWLLMGKLRPRKAASFLGPSALQPPAAAKIYDRNASVLFFQTQFGPQDCLLWVWRGAG